MQHARVKAALDLRIYTHQINGILVREALRGDISVVACEKYIQLKREEEIVWFLCEVVRVELLKADKHIRDISVYYRCICAVCVDGGTGAKKRCAYRGERTGSSCGGRAY